MRIHTRKTVNDWTEYILNNGKMSVNLLNYGATITKIITPDRECNLENIVLTYKDYNMYKENPFYLGSVIGSVAGRIANAQFEIDGKTYNVEKNDGENHLHGGSNGLHKQLWQGEPFEKLDSVGVRFQTTISEKVDGYPGNLDVTVTYTLTNHNELLIDYQAQTDQARPVVLTNHTYFNLTGNAKETVHNHEVQFSSDKILELDEELIPTEEIIDTKGTTFDFNDGRKLSEGLRSNHSQHLIAGNGYDHYFIFNDMPSKVLVSEESSGRGLVIETDQPGMVLYSGNNLDSEVDLLGVVSSSQGKYLGVCFETQAHPVALNHGDLGLPSVIVRPGEKYEQRTRLTFNKGNQ